ncbi:MAG: sulfotransferase [Planctomycetota bacterium]
MADGHDIPLPNVLVIGAAKAGTTSLCAYLDQHPGVCVSHPKETHFFSNYDNYRRGLDHLRRDYFGHWSGEPVVVEGTPDNSALGVYSEVLPRVRADLGRVKCVYMVRHPMRRMESFYSQEQQNGDSLPPFRWAVRERALYIDACRYHTHLLAWRLAMGDENVRVVFFEDFAADTEAAVRDVLAFIGADPSTELDLSASNDRSNHRQDTAAMTAIRRQPALVKAVDTARRVLPTPVVQAGKNLLRRPVTPALWDEAAWAWALERVKPEAEAVLVDQGRPVEYWDFSAPEFL